MMTDWPHAPPHRLTEQGAYMITAGTYRKAHHLNSRVKLDMFQRMLLDGMSGAQWQLHAWAILSNHYHVIASSPANPETLRRVISKLHTLSASLSVYDRFDTQGVALVDGESGVKPPHSKVISLASQQHTPEPEAGEMGAKLQRPEAL
jgi:REP element-mobilizing transposase RayT